jgi:O-antigen/teichoic acid export membrane protein
MPDPNSEKHDALFDVKHIEAGIQKKAVRGASATISATVLNYGLQTIGTIILARLLSPEDFGMVAMVSTFSLLAQNFGANGFVEAVVQSDGMDHQKMSKLFWTNFVIMLGLTVIFAALAPLIAWFFHEPLLKGITLAMAASIFFGGLATCHVAILTRSMKFHLTSLQGVISGVLSTVVAIVAAAQGAGYWALVMRRVSLPFLGAILAWAFCRWKPGIPEKGTRIAPIIRFGVQTYGNFLVDYFRKNADKIIIGKMFGKTSLGHYDRANHLAAVMPNQLSASLGGVGVATFSRLKNDPRKYVDSYAKALSLLAFVAFPGSVWFTLIGRDMITVLLGPQWSEAGKLFTALGPAIGIIIIYETNIWLHLSAGRPDRLLKWGTFVLIAAVAAFLLGSLFGPIGVAVAYSALFYVLLFPALIYAGHPMKIKGGFILAILWKYWFAAFLGGLLYWLFQNGVSFSSSFYNHLAPLTRIFYCFFAYSLIYMVLIFILFRGFKPILLIISTIKGGFRR